MVGPSSPIKFLHPASSLKSTCSTLSSMKIKTSLHTLIVSHVRKIHSAISKSKAAFIASLKGKRQQPTHFIFSAKDKKIKKILFGSFRLHYNWCSSSHVIPVPAPVLDFTYYDSSWNSVIPTDQEQPEDISERQLSGYLQWIEEKKMHDNSTGQQDMNEIDKLAEIFIASCHEKFILEKQESYRRFQEMLARSV